MNYTAVEIYIVEQFTNGFGSDNGEWYVTVGYLNEKEHTKKIRLDFDTLTVRIY